MISITNWRRFLLFVGIIVAIILIGLWRLVAINPLLEKSGTVTVPEGAAADQVWQLFVADGFTSRALPWKYHAWRLGAAGSLQAGIYQLEQGERVRDVIQRLAAGDVSPDELALTFPEGFTVAQMAERTAARGIGTEAEFIAAAADPAAYADAFPFLAELGEGRTLEGYLFPDTYRVFEDDTPADVIRRMLATFDQKVPDDLEAQARVRGRTLDQLVIMASIVEREVITDDDMAKVAGVLWKRFDDGVGLGADATVRYAVDKWDAPLTVTDLATESFYNTRRFRGLPPGPISNPGLRALTAAAKPEASDAYYYLSAPSGETIFSNTLDEHNQNKAEYLQ